MGSRKASLPQAGAPQAGGRRRWARRHARALTALAALGVLGVGSTASLLAAHSVAHTEAERSARSFRAATAQVASALELVMQHEADLLVSTAAFVAGNPGVTNAQFGAWAERLGALRRYPEILGFGHAVIVPAADLAAFAARAVKHPVAPLGPNGTFTVVPPGDRPYYCFDVDNVTRSLADSFPAGYDFCAGPTRTISLEVRDSGQTGYVPIDKAGVSFLSALTPVYRGGGIPSTLAARRATFLGWIGLASVPATVLHRALVGHPSLGVVFAYHGASSHAAFRAGPIGPRDTSILTRLPSGWSVRTYDLVSPDTITANGASLALLLAGLGMSAALALLVLVLSTSRTRALRLVDDKTAELRHQALHDALTGLPNRVLVADRVDLLLRRNRRDGTALAALYLDLDGFKSVNDGLGHEVGDQLLQAVADRLRATLRDVDTIGRLGGDEFVVLLDGGGSPDGPERVATRILDALRQPFVLDGTAAPVVVTISVGVAVGDRPAAADLLRDADVALYEAKAAGRDCYAVFRPEMEAGIDRRYQLELALRQALEEGQLHLVYQPVYELADLTLTAVEALLRWRHPTLGEVGPDEFVPLLEANGQIVDVGRFVLAEACAQVAAWRRLRPGLLLAVNVSGRQLEQDGVVPDVYAALAASGLDAGALTLEITETALMRNVGTTAARLTALKAIGVDVAIDDFGTGYSSLAYLQRFPIDCLKIDREFTATIGSSPEADNLVHSLVQLGKNLGLRTVAEGVETMAQVDRLRQEAVDGAQGYLFSRPLTPAEVEERLVDLIVGAPGEDRTGPLAEPS